MLTRNDHNIILYICSSMLIIAVFNCYCMSCRAQEQGAVGTDWSSYGAFARKWEHSFMHTMDSLGIRRPDALLRVSVGITLCCDA
jgi:hypothetical protein